MDQQLYGLQVNYVSEHGHYMVLTFPHGEQEELSSFQVNMLSANRIPRLLELQVEAKDGQMRLHYNITGKRMLAYWLRMEQLTLRSYYSLLLRIVEILDDSKVYMLQPGRYVLKEEYIYCGSGLQDLYLTYVPKNNLTGKHPVSSDIQQLASRWIHRVTELHGSGFQELMRYLQEDSFNLPELKQLLHNQLNLLEETPAAVPSGIPSSLELPEKPSAVDRKIMEKPQERREFDDMQHAQAVSPILSTDEVYEARGREENRHKKKQLWIVLLTVLMWGLIWKLYADQPQELMLYVCAGLTVLFGAAALVFLRRIRHAAGTETEDEPSVEDWAPDYGDAGGDGGFFSRIGLAEPVQRKEPLKEEIQPVEPFPSLTPAPDLAMRTMLLSPPDATVFLGRPVRKEKRAAPFLEFFRDGVRQQACIQKPGFVIGRAADEADLIHAEEGVSRLHAEILQDQEGYGIRDLGSLNGTTLNGEALVPYQVQPLKEGDIVKIVTTEFTFKMGS
ncbi:DUF6382 domain-containing protein [Paenibacillus naphthalenovorans]|uniref:DUF6382 domain-containing protein n=1 Tax=Paenibacillus naphthalenovorans TaxID=162209 RepID=UPI003D2DEFD4